MSVDLFQTAAECGCAAKVPAHRLSNVLCNINLPSSPNLLVGPETLDDAGVYRISDEQCLVQTIDFFPPVARDPYTYGQIAAANSLSDVYAMGGTPLSALAVICLPSEMLESETIAEITRGAVDKLTEAGAVLLGGHSILDPLLKYGLAVTGTIRPDRILDNAGAMPGDLLILTKSLGTGVTIMAVKGGMADKGQENEANRSMSTLNKDAAQIALEYGATACTDVTGFGLLGHAYQMAKASNVAMEIWLDRVPRLNGVLEYAGMGLLSAATYANRKYVGENVTFETGIGLAEQDLLFDPQTSGGLLIALPEKKAYAALEAAEKNLTTPCKIVGKIIKPVKTSTITVRKSAP
jgi:selenide,water dikinase